jgi:hypothetical protein
MLQVYRDLEQGSEEWLRLRLGIVTMSELSPLLVGGKDVSGFGTGALTYMNKLIAERILGEPAESYSGWQTQMGHADEPVIRQLHAERIDCEITQVGFMTNHGCGYSPDGEIGADGLAEYKRKVPHIQCQIILDDKVPDEHIDQCQGGLWVSEREWIDFVSYCPGLPLFVKRVHRDEALIKKYAEAVERFYFHLEKRMQRILKADLGF